MTRSLLREHDPESDYCLDGWDGGSLAIAAANLANDPTTFLQLSNGADSPVRKGDTFVVDNADALVQSASPAGIKVVFPDGAATMVPPSQEIFIDPANASGRPKRARKQRTMFTFTPKKRRPPAVKGPLGLNLIGRVFLSDSPGREDVEFTILRAGDTRKFMKKGTKIPVPFLEHVETSSINDNDRFVHQSTVTEVRKWLRLHDKHVAAAKVAGDVDDSGAEAVLLPLLKMGPVELELVRDKALVPLMKMSTREKEVAKEGPHFGALINQRREVLFDAASGQEMNPPSTESRVEVQVKGADRKTLSAIREIIGPLPVEQSKAQDALLLRNKFRLLLSKISTCRKTKRWPRKDIIKVLTGRAHKMKIRKRHTKFGMEIPSSYKDCHRASIPESEQTKWRTEEVEEVSTLCDDLKIIVKGFHINELRKEMPDLQPMPGMWVHDAHPAGVKLTDRRARWVANGARDPDEGKEESYSPVGQLVTARVLMGIVNQLEMDLEGSTQPESCVHVGGGRIC
jgi:hypothetical protein